MIGDPITPTASPTDGLRFAQLELAALDGMQDLVERAPKATRLLLALIRRLRPYTGGVVVIGRETMREIVGCSMPTLDRALKTLIDEGWVQRIRVGGAHAIAINHRVAWMGPRGEIQHAVFGATVVASRKEQDAIALDPPPMRTVPIVSAGEQVVTVGQGATPPRQSSLTGYEPALRADEEPN